MAFGILRCCMEDGRNVLTKFFAFLMLTFSFKGARSFFGFLNDVKIRNFFVRESKFGAFVEDSDGFWRKRILLKLKDGSLDGGGACRRRRSGGGSDRSRRCGGSGSSCALLLLLLLKRSDIAMLLLLLLL